MSSATGTWKHFEKEKANGIVGDRTLARCISLVENGVEGFAEFLESVQPSNTPVIGITGAPGSGKSTITDGLISEAVRAGKRVAVLCVDPSSPFNFGAVLGDRIRMNEWYTHPDVFIRSLASRGALGGLHPRIIEITDVVRSAGFDLVIVETVGVGQSEIEIAGLADTTVVVVVHEGGDEVQTLKAGIMEIADIFVLNKADRPGSQEYMKNLRMMMAPAFQRKDQEIPIIATVASERKGIQELFNACMRHTYGNNEKKTWLITEKIIRLIQFERMKDIAKETIYQNVREKFDQPDFNIYRFAKQYFKRQQ